VAVLLKEHLYEHDAVVASQKELLGGHDAVVTL
jgi:hypothetical protein